MYSMMYDANFTYDSSMPIYENKPPSFPYTLDYKVLVCLLIVGEKTYNVFLGYFSLY